MPRPPPVTTAICPSSEFDMCSPSEPKGQRPIGRSAIRPASRSKLRPARPASIQSPPRRTTTITNALRAPTSRQSATLFGDALARNSIGSGQIGIIHTAENAPDVVLPECGAEAGLRYCTESVRPASYCRLSDSMYIALPLHHVAFGCGGRRRRARRFSDDCCRRP